MISLGLNFPLASVVVHPVSPVKFLVRGCVSVLAPPVVRPPAGETIFYAANCNVLEPTASVEAPSGHMGPG